MVAALAMGGAIGGVGTASAVGSLPINIVCPQVNACSVIATALGSGQAVAVDDDGNSYVASAEGVLWRVAPNGAKTQIATGLGNLYGVVLDGGNFYVVSVQGLLQRVTPGGVKTTITTGLGSAFGMAMGSDGNFYVTNDAGVLQRVTPGGVKTTITTGLGTAEGVVLDDDGNSYVTNDAGVLQRVTPGGVKTTITTGLGKARGVALDGDGNFYVASRSLGVLWRVSPGGVKETVASNIGSGAVRAYGLALDGQGNAFVTASTSQDLYRLPGVSVPLNAPPAAPTVTAPKNGATTGAFPKFTGKAIGENGAVDADEVRILDENNVILDTVAVRQSDGYFSWTQDGSWSAGEHTVRFIALHEGRESAPTSLKFIVAPGPAAPKITNPANNSETGPKPKFTGMAAGADKVLIQNLDNTTIAEVGVRGDGYFSWTAADNWTPGPHTIQFVAKNSQGLSQPTPFTFIVHIPAPTVVTPANNSNSGTLPKFTGTAPANSTVVFYENNVKLGTAQVNSAGNYGWRLIDGQGTWLNWSKGLHTVDVYTNIAGTQSVDHATTKFTVV
ncbi:hypothetical protein [Streptomyces goshikiensis]|uniref:hypothetical protein n=1 Tax=Streptomyces goshikiensis TaxID=1942 RepID=UPI0037A8344C